MATKPPSWPLDMIAFTEFIGPVVTVQQPPGEPFEHPGSDETIVPSARIGVFHVATAPLLRPMATPLLFSRGVTVLTATPSPQPPLLCSCAHPWATGVAIWKTGTVP